ncbi:MAG: hypothetical protein ACLPIX_07730, partial [Rhodomicrobium sp.]
MPTDQPNDLVSGATAPLYIQHRTAASKYKHSTSGLALLLDLPVPDIGAWPGLAPLFDLFAMPGDAVAAE